ncbi:hypothetical protein bas12_0050 [Escherichia phage BrunoManser]|uniref:Uncharacterized protein n=1 Tax=Escherichia phage BrunoManser TaxID=2851976 RepID=A0AAE7VPR8_9CAUD|nr:hypothetical protein bas12_0050 [Escherichia phage BrunoManser]
MKQDNFWTRYFTALDSGLNHEFCLKVAYKEVSLDEALGNMNMDDESELDPDFVMTSEDNSIPGEDYIPW